MQLNEWVIDRDIADFREEDIRHFNKEIKHLEMKKLFRKDFSIFRRWEDDTPSKLVDCIDYDNSLWKIRNIKEIKLQAVY